MMRYTIKIEYKWLGLHFLSIFLLFSAPLPFSSITKSLSLSENQGLSWASEVFNFVEQLSRIENRFEAIGTRGGNHDENFRDFPRCNQFFLFLNDIYQKK